jgi:glycosyltransferase involved in cell wall biosynthesis
MVEKNLLNRRSILIVTTVPETLATILSGQPNYLSKYFNVHLATSPGEFINQIYIQENIEVSILPMERGISPLKDIVSIVRMIALLRNFQPDLVHSYTPKAGLITMIAAWICRINVRIHTFTGLIFPTSHGIKKHILIWIDKLICACATHVIPEGKGVKYDLERFNITHKPLNVIGHGNIAGVNTSYFSKDADNIKYLGSSLRQRLGINDSAFVFCYVGRLNADKGIQELVMAFEQQPISSHLLLVGKLDKTAPISQRVLTAINENPRIHSLGFLEDIRPALIASNVLILASYREGFPNVILQAGSMQLPVIASDINGCNEIINTGFNGWLIQPQNTKALTQAMNNVIQLSETELKLMGYQARKYVQSNFEQYPHWQRLESLYSLLINKVQ